DVHICITDPPYGVEFEYNDHKDTRENLRALVDGFVPIVRDLCQTVLITPGNSNQRLYPEPDWTLCWFCSAGVGRGPWGFTCWQPVLAYGKDPFLKMGKGSRPDSYASNEGKPANVKHTCPKPVGVWRWFMDRADPTECATFFDPFGGSGTTMICAEMSGRRSVLIEKDPCYVDVIVQRWQNFTGEQATLDGKTFDEVSDAA
ncbi:MAG: DNA methyltransferase, partial [Hyphomicrobium sp.]